ncbi:MAG: ATP-grasp domain-containing protein [Planctomycetota bacterium]
MNVIMISPGFPAEMPLFTRALAQVGASVLGVGDQPQAALEPDVRQALTGYLQVRNLWEEEQTIAEIQSAVRGKSVDRVECLWEPGMILAARLRAALGVPGMGLEQTKLFRDKESMKQALDRAGIRTPHHFRATNESEVRDAAERIGYPLIVKPIDGAGSRDTYLLHEAGDLDQALQLVKHVPEVSVEEYIEGEEYTYDTVCAGREVAFENVSWYRPKPMFMSKYAWVSPQSIVFRDLEQEEIAAGRDLGRRVLEALEFDTGFTHMEWFRTADGEPVFGEIAARPPGARLVHAMNYSCDTDLFSGWAEAACYGRFSQPTEKVFNAGMIFKRAQGEGRISRIEGLQSLLAHFGEHIANIELSPVGTPKRDHRKVVIGDGWLVVRHPDLQTTIDMSERVATDLRMYAS